MVSRPRSWWKNTSKTLKIALIIGLAVGLIVSFIGGYFFNWTWTGFGPYTPPTSNFQREKTLYDWLQLAIIPAVLTFGIWWLTRLQQQRDQQLADRQAKSERETAEKRAQTEREISLDNQHEVALQAYIDNMSVLLLEKDLREPVELDKIRKIARVRTLTVLPRCDGRRKAIVLQFLCEAGLIDKNQKIVDLDGADLSEADLFRAQLSKADLSRANLSRANLIEANLIEANLSSTVLTEANLSSAKLVETYLRGADLSEAILDGAIVTNKQLEEAKSLKGATMPNGTKHVW